MSKKIEEVILAVIEKKGRATVKDLLLATQVSRAYISRCIRPLLAVGKILRFGHTNNVQYVLNTPDLLRAMKNTWSRNIKNIGLEEDVIWRQAVRYAGAFEDVPENVLRIVEYAFSEILNNAIEHSQSNSIKLLVTRQSEKIVCVIEDSGVGIFNNVMQKRSLKNELEAVQDIFKGKQTTMPATHSGQGIFFTSKVVDHFWVISGRLKIHVDNILPDFFVEPARHKKGTRVEFSITTTSSRHLRDIFNQFSDEEYRFDKTRIRVKLYVLNESFVSRSQARRLLAGLEEFRVIILDFDQVKNIGQGFADEIFRVYQQAHPQVRIEAVNMTSEVEFMVRRV